MRKQIVVDNRVLAYLDEGAGPVILMLHGWASSAVAFDGLASHYAKNYRVIRPDLPGFGGSEAPRYPWTVLDYSRFVAEFLAKLHINADLIIGHSFGGRVAIKGVASGELKPDKLVLIGSAGISETKSSRNQVLKGFAKAGKVATSLPGLRRYQDRLRQKLYQGIGATDYLNAGELQQTFKNVIEEDLRPDARQVKIPTLLIYGQNDTETKPAQGRLLAEQMPHARLEIIPGAGHYAFLDQPTEVTQCIGRFLQ